MLKDHLSLQTGKYHSQILGFLLIFMFPKSAKFYNQLTHQLLCYITVTCAKISLHIAIFCSGLQDIFEGIASGPGIDAIQTILGLFGRHHEVYIF